MTTIHSETVIDHTGKTHKVELIGTVTVNGYDEESKICTAYIDGAMHDWSTEFWSDKIYRRAKLAAKAGQS